jgi:TonB-linked SusC/RagA family outer membrane protein
MYGLWAQMMFAGLLVAADGNAQQRSLNEIEVSIDKSKSNLADVLQDIGQQSDFKIVYNDLAIGSERVVRLKVQAVSLQAVFEQLSKDYNLHFRRVNDNIFVARKPVKTEEAPMQGVTVTGRVTTSEDGGSLPGVNVIVQGTAQGTVTDANGNYSLEVPSAESVLVYSSVGYISEEIAVGNRTVIDLSLTPDITALEEIVVVGYGAVKKSDLTGAVSTLTDEQFDDQPIFRLDEALQGRTPGVQVVRTSGAPGGSSRVRIRGSNSISGGNSPLYVIDGFIGASINDINPNDVENMQVLKDASATAIYGSRGANGVVLITTKKGKTGKAKVSLAADYSFNEVINRMEMLDARGFANTYNDYILAQSPTATPFYSEAEINAFGSGTDWQDLIYRTGAEKNIQLSVSGGSEKVEYYISGNYFDEEGILINTGFNRFNLTSNVNVKLSNKMDLGFNFLGSRRNHQNTSNHIRHVGPIMQSVLWPATIEPYDSEGNYTPSANIATLTLNPIASAELQNYDRINTQGLINTNYTYRFIKGFDFTTRFLLQYRENKNRDFEDVYLTQNNPFARNGSVENVTWQSTSMLTYNNNIGEMHKINATAAFELYSSESTGFSAMAGNLLFPFLNYYNLSLAGSANISSSYSKFTMVSYIGRLNYSFADRYLLTATLRSDGSSRLVDKFDLFPSVGLGWIVTEESFMQGIDALSNLKFRASYGIAGSQAIAPYSSLALLQQSANNTFYSFNGSTDNAGYIVGNPANPNLAWEKTRQFNVGIDLGLFQDRLRASFDYYKKNTFDLLLNKALPMYAPGSTITENVGEVENEGFEISLDVTPIESDDFSLNFNINYSYNDNVVIDIGDEDLIFLNELVASEQNASYILKEGESLGTLYGYNYLGTWKLNEAEEAERYGEVPGDSRYEDVNDDGKLNSSDLQVIGNTLPRSHWGLNTRLDYKNFSFNMFWQATTNVEKVAFDYGSTLLPIAHGSRASTHVDILDRWSPSNDGSNIPHFSDTDKFRPQSNQFLMDASYFRMRNISITYSLPKSLLRVAQADVTLSGQNLITLTNFKGMDPETDSYTDEEVDASDAYQGFSWGAYPNTKSITLGLNINF